MAEARKNPPLLARDKLTFLLSFVPWLVDHERVSVTEAAEHFGMTPEQIREAVRLIAMSGVPGDTAQYQHGDLFDISWDSFEDDDEIVLTHRVAIDGSPRFSAREAAAVIAGLQYLSAVPENADRAALTSLLGKLSRSASSAPSPLGVDASMHSDATLSLVRASVERGVQLEFDYLNARGERERRRIDPLRVESADADWYVRGWCHLRRAVRTFRVDRIASAVVTDEPIEHHAGQIQVPETLFDASLTDLDVRIEVASAAMPLLDDYLHDDAAVEAHGDRMRATLRVSHFHGLKRLVAGLPGMVVVVSPPEAREAVRAWAAEGAARYR
ncbi:YafY family protein [uncultured Schumannella sp.]|uniref:helix-turn-helix transcriptional regulator n=1 Tax=uncultured Schumannella sp. TaxID=1195956 RepID=UPI0025E8C177|nr:WYL domain-containing protein [uncultured Schumannella sp.]